MTSSIAILHNRFALLQTLSGELLRFPFTRLRSVTDLCSADFVMLRHFCSPAPHQASLRLVLATCRSHFVMRAFILQVRVPSTFLA